MLPEVGVDKGSSGYLVSARGRELQPLSKLLDWYSSIPEDTPRFARTIKLRAMYETGHGAHDHTKPSEGFPLMAYKDAEAKPPSPVFSKTASDYVMFGIDRFGIDLFQYQDLTPAIRGYLNMVVSEIEKEKQAAEERERIRLELEARARRGQDTEPDLPAASAMKIDL